MAGEHNEKGQVAPDDSIFAIPDHPSRFNEADLEMYGAKPDSNPLPDLKRKLKSRHLQMIAIGASMAS